MTAAALSIGPPTQTQTLAAKRVLGREAWDRVLHGRCAAQRGDRQAGSRRYRLGPPVKVLADAMEKVRYSYLAL